jgi:hypothetical protein
VTDPQNDPATDPEKTPEMKPEKTAEKTAEKKPEKKPVATSRVVIWVVVAGIAVYYIAKGLLGLYGN